MTGPDVVARRRWAATGSAWAVWAAGVGAYAVAVLHRGSLGVAGVDAVERFGVGAAVLSTFVMVQLAVYAGLQVPVGVLLDRFGSRRLITVGALLMAAGQLLLGTASDLPAAYAARVLVGAGDAATFISVIRLVAAWFPPGRVPLLTQLTGLVGQLGQLAATVPLAAALHAWGWTSAFVGLGAVGVVAAAAALATVRDAPPGVALERRRGGLIAPLRAVAATPGTWLGFWSHAVTPFPMTVFLLLWGFPFLVSAQGLSTVGAGALMTVVVVATLVSGPAIGVLTARHPLRRTWMVLAIAGATAVVWAAVLVRSEPSPQWLLVLLALVLGVGGPGSAIGFDFARTANPPERLGTATGLVNVGGFATALLSVLAVGVVLDVAAAAGAEPLSLAAFRPAFAVMAVPWLAGVVGVVVTRRRTRRAWAAQGLVVPPFREAVRRRRGRG